MGTLHAIGETAQWRHSKERPQLTQACGRLADGDVDVDVDAALHGQLGASMRSSERRAAGWKDWTLWPGVDPVVGVILAGDGVTVCVFDEGDLGTVSELAQGGALT